MLCKPEVPLGAPLGHTKWKFMSASQQIVISCRDANLVSQISIYKSNISNFHLHAVLSSVSNFHLQITFRFSVLNFHLQTLASQISIYKIKTYGQISIYKIQKCGLVSQISIYKLCLDE